MKIIHASLIIVIAALFCVSCEGPKYFSVTVVDKKTQQPIDSVLVLVKVKAGNEEKTAYNLQGFTDSVGKFKREEMIGYGLSMTRWDFYMEYFKKGYLPKTELNHPEGKVELEPLLPKQ